MRSFLLVIATATAVYIAYYLTVYTDLFNRRAPQTVISTPVELTPAVPVTLPVPLATPTTLNEVILSPTPVAIPTALDPEEASNNPLLSETLALIHEGGEKGLQHGIEQIFGTELNDEEKQTIGSALQKKYQERFPHAVLSFLKRHLENHPASTTDSAVLDRSVGILLSSKDVALSQWLEEQLLNSDTASRQRWLQALAKVDKITAGNQHQPLVRTLFETISTTDTPSETSLEASNAPQTLLALSKFHGEFTKEQKQQFWNSGLEFFRQTAGTASAVRDSLTPLLKGDPFYAPLIREALEQEPSATPTHEWLQTLLPKNVVD